MDFIWGKLTKKDNQRLDFILDLEKECDYLTICAVDFYQVYLDGKLHCYGPARTASGYIRPRNISVKGVKSRFKAACKGVAVKGTVKALGHGADGDRIPSVVSAAFKDKIIIFVARHCDQLVDNYVPTAAIRHRSTAAAFVKTGHFVFLHNTSQIQKMQNSIHREKQFLTMRSIQFLLKRMKRTNISVKLMLS